MSVTDPDPFQDPLRGGWVRLRTLVVLRWAAIAGQTAATVAAVLFFDVTMELGLVSMTIGASVVANLFSLFLYPQTKRLSEREAGLMLVFDLLQLGLLLYLTGGLNNPFALLILAPATIAATLLPLRSSVLMAALTIVVITLAGLWHLPLRSDQGAELVLPALFRFGFWVALVIGVAFLAIYAHRVTDEMQTMSEALVATQMALAREQKLTDLGGVVAAAAHELGTPLATIKLVASELIDELEDRPALREDAVLLRAQADRCRDILRSMGRAGKDDLHLRRAPLEAVVREAAEPHTGRGKHLDFRVPAEREAGRQPLIQRRPEIIHGLRNLIQNATDFAAATVLVELAWTEGTVVVRIEDDGPGFPTSVMPRIGDPFVRSRRGAEERAARPGYEGMGLGLFIAKTLLERSGARMHFANGGAAGTRGGGAIVVVEWQRAGIEAEPTGLSGLGDNAPIAG